MKGREIGRKTTENHRNGVLSWRVEGKENLAKVKRCSGLYLPSQLDRNHSLRQYPAGTFYMEIHDRVNIWTQCRSNTYIIGNSSAAYLAAAFIQTGSTCCESICLIWNSQATLNLYSFFPPTDITNASEQAVHKH